MYDNLLRCLNCPYGMLVRREDGAFVCPNCHRQYERKNGVLSFVTGEFQHTDDSAFQQEEMRNSSALAKLYNLGKSVVNSEYLVRDQIRAFVASAPRNAVIVELGSGSRRLAPHVINVDLFPLPNVDMTMDVAQTAFRDASVDCVILDCVLEHVPEPAKVIDEVFRILKPGGRVISVTPWLFPYHGYPKNYFNISEDGHRFLMRRFSSVSVEIHHGPTSALTNILSEYFAVAFSGRSKFRYTLLKGLFLLPIFWLKYLDRLWYGNPRSHRLASSMCVLGIK